MSHKNDLLLRSVEELNRHLSTIQQPPETDIWWTCPNCQTANFGLSYTRYSRCAECHAYFHPPVRYDVTLEVQVADLEEEIRDLNAELEDAAGKVNELEELIADRRRMLYTLKANRPGKKPRGEHECA